MRYLSFFSISLMLTSTVLAAPSGLDRQNTLAPQQGVHSFGIYFGGDKPLNISFDCPLGTEGSHAVLCDCADENAHFSETEKKCVCDDGFAHIANRCVKKCAANEVWLTDKCLPNPCLTFKETECLLGCSVGANGLPLYTHKTDGNACSQPATLNTDSEGRTVCAAGVCSSSCSFNYECDTDFCDTDYFGFYDGVCRKRGGYKVVYQNGQPWGVLSEIAVSGMGAASWCQGYDGDKYDVVEVDFVESLTDENNRPIVGKMWAKNMVVDFGETVLKSVRTDVPTTQKYPALCKRVKLY